RQIVDARAAPGSVPAHPVRHPTDLPGDFAEVRHEALPLSRQAADRLRRVVPRRSCDQQGLAILEARGLELPPRRLFPVALPHFYLRPRVGPRSVSLPYLTCKMQVINASFKGWRRPASPSAGRGVR